MLVLAHRGASVVAPENTPEAFRAADAMGADGVELDVRLAPDGRLVVRHDPLVVGGVAAGRLPVDLAGLADLDAALDACGTRMLVNIELKNIESEPDFDPAMRIVDRLLDVLAERPADERRLWLVSSFSWSTLERCRAAMPAVPTAWLVLDASEDVVRRAAVAGDLALHPWVGAVTEEVVARCHDAGLAVHAWTCNDAARLVELADAGVDGVCTDVPDVALEALGRPADGDAPAVSPRWGRRA